LTNSIEKYLAMASHVEAARTLLQERAFIYGEESGYAIIASFGLLYEKARPYNLVS